MSLDDIKARTRCRRCQETGHWSRECPEAHKEFSANWNWHGVLYYFMCFRKNSIPLCFFIIISGVMVAQHFNIGSDTHTNADDTIDEETYVIAGDSQDGTVV